MFIRSQVSTPVFAALGEIANFSLFLRSTLDKDLRSHNNRAKPLPLLTSTRRNRFNIFIESAIKSVLSFYCFCERF
jgi:hypothetical protein